MPTESQLLMEERTGLLMEERTGSACGQYSPARNAGGKSQQAVPGEVIPESKWGNRVWSDNAPGGTRLQELGQPGKVPTTARPLPSWGAVGTWGFESPLCVPEH